MPAETKHGDVAQLGERSTRIAEVGGSNPLVSTILSTPHNPPVYISQAPEAMESNT